MHCKHEMWYIILQTQWFETVLNEMNALSLNSQKFAISWVTPTF